MILTSEILSKLADLELSPTQLSGVLALLADAVSTEEERKRKDRDRKRARKSGADPGNSTETPGIVLGFSAAPSPKEIFKPPSNYTGGDAGARDLDNLFAKLCEAAGGAIDDTQPRMMVLSEPRAWLAAGADLDADILPVIRALSKGKGERKLRRWSYFTDAIAEARERRLSGLTPANSSTGHANGSRKPTVSELAFDIARQAREREAFGQLPAVGSG